MKKHLHINSRFFLIFIFLILFSTSCSAQIISLGYKGEKKGMFQATFNYLLFENKKRPSDLLVGLDFTTKNSEVPSGLAAQISPVAFIAMEKDFSMFIGVSSGYLLDINKEFKNQFRVSPHFYTEIGGIVNFKFSYDYFLPLKKGYPAISIGLGGLHTFNKHPFSIY